MANRPILVTKLYRPQPRSDLTPRPRLLEVLGGALRLRRKLILLSAPAGFGKTTLVQTWLHQMKAEVSIAWLSLDEADSDPQQFLQYLVAALQQVIPTIGRTLPPFLNDAPSSPLSSVTIERTQTPLEKPLTLLINDLASLARPLVLVLDDYHLIETEAIHRGVTFLLDYLPPQTHVVITSRTDPPLPLARLRLRGQLTELKAADLRFSPTEVATFFEQTLGQSLPTDSIALLDERTEGWVAALQAVALSLPGQADISAFIDTFSGSHRYLLDYLAEEVLTHQPPAVQEFLLQTSILKRLCGPLCEAVLGTGAEKRGSGGELFSTSQTMLEHLEAKNLFLVPLDDVGEWYRYHHLFAEFLRHQVRQRYPDRLPDLHRRATAWLAAQALWPEAIRHAFAAGDSERAAALVERTGRTLWMRGELTTLTGWLEQLPETTRRQRPHLCLLEAWTLFPARRLAEVEAWVEAAEAAMAADTTGVDELRGEVALIRAVVARMQSDARQTVALSQRALALLSPGDLTLRSTAALNLGHGLRQIGDLAAAGDAFDEAIALGQATDNLYTVVLALGNRAALHIEQGQPQTAEQLYRQALRLAADKGANSLPVTGVVHIGLGKLYVQANDVEKAETHLRLGLERAEQGDHLHLLLDGYRLLAQVRIGQGDNAEADTLRQKADHLARQIDLRFTLYDLRQEEKDRPKVSQPDSPLSQRELDVLRHVATGASNQAIAEAMVVTIHTVKKHVSHILQKLGVASRTEAVARAREMGILG